MPTQPLPGPVPCMSPHPLPQACEGTSIGTPTLQKRKQAQEGQRRARQPQSLSPPTTAPKTHTPVQAPAGQPVEGEVRCSLRGACGHTQQRTTGCWEPSGLAGPLCSQTRQPPRVSSQGLREAFGFPPDLRGWPQGSLPPGPLSGARALQLRTLSPSQSWSSAALRP